MIGVSFPALLVSALCLLGPKSSARAFPFTGDKLIKHGQLCKEQTSDACLDINTQVTKPILERGTGGTDDDSCTLDTDVSLTPVFDIMSQLEYESTSGNPSSSARQRLLSGR